MPVVTSKYKNVFLSTCFTFSKLKPMWTAVCFLLGCDATKNLTNTETQASSQLPCNSSASLFFLLVPSNLRQKILCDIFPKVLWNIRMGQLQYIIAVDLIYGALKPAVWWPFYLKASVLENNMLSTFHHGRRAFWRFGGTHQSPAERKTRGSCRNLPPPAAPPSPQTHAYPWAHSPPRGDTAAISLLTKHRLPLNDTKGGAERPPQRLYTVNPARSCSPAQSVSPERRQDAVLSTPAPVKINPPLDSCQSNNKKSSAVSHGSGQSRLPGVVFDKSLTGVGMNEGGRQVPPTLTIYTLSTVPQGDTSCDISKTNIWLVK